MVAKQKVMNFYDILNLHAKLGMKFDSWLYAYSEKIMILHVLVEKSKQIIISLKCYKTSIIFATIKNTQNLIFRSSFMLFWILSLWLFKNP